MSVPSSKMTVTCDRPYREIERVSSSRGPCVGSLHALHVPLAGRSDILGKVGNMRGQSVRCKPIACKSQPSCFPEMPIAIAISEPTGKYGSGGRNVAILADFKTNLMVSGWKRGIC